MPCRSDHMEANAREAYSRDTAKLIVYAAGALATIGVSIGVPSFVSAAADTYYGAPSRHDEITEILCSICRTMSEPQQSVVIYDGRNADARKLAEWWDNHQKVDAARIAEETAKDYRVVWMVPTGALSISDCISNADADELIRTKLDQGVGFIQKVKRVTQGSMDGIPKWVAVQ